MSAPTTIKYQGRLYKRAEQLSPQAASAFYRLEVPQSATRVAQRPEHPSTGTRRLQRGAPGSV